MDHMSVHFLRRISDTGSNTFMVSSLYTQLRLRVASQKGEASQAPDTSSCVSALERGACCKKENYNLHSFARTAKRRRSPLGAEIYARTSSFAKRQLTNAGAKRKESVPRRLRLRGRSVTDGIVLSLERSFLDPAHQLPTSP